MRDDAVRGSSLLALARRPASNLRRAPAEEGESRWPTLTSNRARLHGSRCDSAARDIALPCEQRHGARTGYLFRRLPLRSEARQGAHG